MQLPSRLNHRAIPIPLPKVHARGKTLPTTKHSDAHTTSTNRAPLRRVEEKAAAAAATAANERTQRQTAH